jgi:FkbM family methyltransferase
MTMTATPPPFLSYSANHEDVLLNRLFGTQQHGFFVDVGAAHPLFENDTRALYERGWHGINIEPTAGFYRELEAQRPRDLNLNVVVSDAPGALVFHEVVGTGLSTGDAEEAARAAAKGFEVIRHTVTARTLRDILQEAAPPAIDVLKVDVEGFELRVMQSNDWSRFRPRLILAEATFPDTSIRRQDGVTEYLAEQGYRHVYFDGLNNYYAERDFTAAAAAFDRPLSLFDRYVPFIQHELARANTALESLISGLHQEQHTAATTIAALQAKLAQQEAGEARLAEEHRRSRLAVEAQRVDLDHAHAELIAMRRRCEALAADMDATAMRQLVPVRIAPSGLPATAEADQIARQIESVYASTSWRITRPLRVLVRWGRSLGLLRGRS